MEIMKLWLHITRLLQANFMISRSEKRSEQVHEISKAFDFDIKQKHFLEREAAKSLKTSRDWQSKLEV